MTFVVLDASVAIKWYVREDGSDDAQKLLDSDVLFLARDLLFVEVSAALLRQHREYGQLSGADVRQAIEDILRLGIETVSSSVLLVRAVELSLALGHPVRDCFYIALAERQRIVFVTADKQLIRKTDKSEWAGVTLPLERIGDIV